MITVTTGNKLDIVYTYDENSKRKVLGLLKWDDPEEKMIPLPNPEGFYQELGHLLGY